MDAELPLVSIVTPSLNQGPYIEAAIRSLLEQDYPRVEHIVVDGGSQDDTVATLRAFEHLRWLSEPDRGQAQALNKGFALAAGAVFGWLNADDLYLPGAVSAAVDALRRSECALVHGSWRQIDDEGRTIRDVPAVPFDLRRQLEVANRVAQPGAFFTRAAYVAVGGIDESYRYAMDYEFFLRLARAFPVCHVGQVLGAYRYHAASKTVAEPAGFVPETWRASRAHGARLRSRMFLDYYLPRERPWLFRVLLAYRLLAAGDLRGLARRVRRRLHS